MPDCAGLCQIVPNCAGCAKLCRIVPDFEIFGSGLCRIVPDCVDAPDEHDDAEQVCPH